MIPLDDVLRELDLVVLQKVKAAENDYLFYIGRRGSDFYPLPPEQCALLYSQTEQNPEIYEEEAEMLRRRFPPSPATRSLDIGPTGIA